MQQTLQINSVRWSVVDEGSGAVLLLVHGFPLDHSMWRTQIADLSNQFRVIAPDLVGFGASSMAEDQTLSMSRLADDLAELLDQLRVPGAVHYCGLSMGGYVGWQMWNRHRDRLARLIQCDTRAASDTPEVARGRQLMADDVLRQGADMVSQSLLLKLFDAHTIEARSDVVQQTKEVILGTNPRAIAAAQRGMAEREDFAERLSEIELPTLFVCGQSDAISPPSEMRELAARVPQGQYLEIAAAGHLSPLENPTAFNEGVREFLDKN